jgi:hypothetical protein
MRLYTLLILFLIAGCSEQPLLSEEQKKQKAEYFLQCVGKLPKECDQYCIYSCKSNIEELYNQ